MRFLFPAVFFVPFFAVFAWSKQPDWLSIPDRLRPMLVCIVAGLAILNLGAAVLTPLAAGDIGEFRLFRKITKEAARAPGDITAVAIRGDAERFYIRNELNMSFIEPDNLRWISDPDEATLGDLLRDDKAFLAVVDVPNANEKTAALIKSRCRQIQSTWPDWIRVVLQWSGRSGGLRRDLYRCR